MIIVVALLLEASILKYVNDKNAHRTSKVLLDRVITVLDKNDENRNELIESLKDDYIVRAKVVSYMIDADPAVEYDVNELQKIEKLMAVDEIHLFDDQGTIYSGSAPKYYFLSDSDDSREWQKIYFQNIDGSGNSRTDTVKIKGNYQENTAGTGDYTKQEQQYYPIRKNDNDDKAKPEKYRENIQNFYYADNNTADAPYFLEFQEVDNNTVNQAFDTNHNKINNNSILKEYDYSKGNYGYNENVYSDLTAEIVQNI